MWTGHAWDDYLSWQEVDKEVKRIIELIKVAYSHTK